MVKDEKEGEGKALSFGGRYKQSKEFTEKYEFLNAGFKAADQLLDAGEKCSPEFTSAIRTALTVIDDMKPSNVKKSMICRLITALELCEKGGSCPIK